MKLLLSIVSLFYCLNSEGQSAGIDFKQGLTWEEIVNKATQENKYIFVDCYATWCKPCKEMDMKVYPESEVGTLMNQNFIAVKVQMDSTKNDDEKIKKMFPAARLFERKYKIAALPTYLFFSPTGKIVHRAQGSLDPQQFMALVNASLVPDSQLYTLVQRWKDHKIDYSSYPWLTQTLHSYKEDSLSAEVARDYIQNYLEHLPENELLRKENLQFVSINKKALSATNLLFRYYQNEPGRIDSIIGQKGHAVFMRDAIINSDEITPALKYSMETGVEPNWKKLEATIIEKYDKSILQTTVLPAKISWYKSQKDWKNYTHYVTQQMKLIDLDELTLKGYGLVSYLNYYALEIFNYSNKKDELKIALKWCDFAESKSDRKYDFLLDTKATILQKLGRKKEALMLYKQVVELNPETTIIYKCIESDLPTYSDAMWPSKMEKKKGAAERLQESVKAMRMSQSTLDSIKAALTLNRPNLSGVWKINYFRSDFGTAPGYVAAKQLDIMMGKDSMEVERYNFDVQGNPTYRKEKFSIDEKLSTYWDKEKKNTITALWSSKQTVLTTISTSPYENKKRGTIQEDKRTQKWILTNDGKTLIVEQSTELSGNPGAYVIIAVYEKQ